MAGILDYLFAPAPGLPGRLSVSPGQQVFLANPLEQPEVSAQQRENLEQFGRGRVAGTLAMAPDLIDMVARGPVQPFHGPGALQVAQQLASQGIDLPQQGQSLPFMPEGADPIYDVAGVDRGNPFAVAGEFLGIEAPVQKGLNLAGRGLRALADEGLPAVLAGTIPGLTRGADDGARVAAEAVQAGEPLPKIRAKSFVDQGHTARGRQRFNQHLEEARANMDPGSRAQVDAALPDDFKGKVFMTDDGGAGFALSDDGYLSHLYKDPNAPFRGTMGAALTKARAAGGKNLEAFDTHLVRGYLSRGAVETNRFPFDPNEATPEIIQGLGDRRPDFVQMDIGGQVPTRKYPESIPPRAQAELERFHAARGEPTTVAEAFRGGKVQRLNRLVDKGIEQGGDKWYWMGGLLDQFVAQYGPDIGKQRFDRFMDLNAAVSPRSTVMKEIERASILYQREIKGLSIDDMLQPKGTKGNPKGRDPAFPQGTGHLAHNIHMQNVDRLLRQGGFSSVDQPKIASYAENLKGNYRPVTVDTHNAFVLTGRRGPPTKKSPLGDPKGPSKAQFPFMESRQQVLAERRGLDPAEWQSALWVGAGDITGVADVRNFPDAMNVRIAKTAEVLDITEQEALVRFMSGDTRLYSVMAALVGAGVLQEAADAESGQAQ